MRVILDRPDPHGGALALASIEFDDPDLAGLRLVGFRIYQTPTSIYVTLPARAFGVGKERRYFDFLRGDKAAIIRVKAAILAAFTKALASK